MNCGTSTKTTCFGEEEEKVKVEVRVDATTSILFFWAVDG